MSNELGDLLERTQIEASAPGRVDCGGTWDQKGFALVEERMRPATVNIAVDLRTTVRLKPFDRGAVQVSAEGLASGEARHGRLPLTRPLGHLFAVLAHFDVAGVSVEITSQIPPSSGLGGSGVVTVATIAAVGKALELAGQAAAKNRHRVARLAYDIEDGLAISRTGLEDQLAAAFGGVNKWTWCYSRPARPYRREVLVPLRRHCDLESRILLVYTGEPRDSSVASERYFNAFTAGDQESWIEVCRCTDTFADALRTRDWPLAASSLDREATIRERIVPGAVTPLARELRKSARDHGCGCGFAGGNRSGCLWAIGEEAAITGLRRHWAALLEGHASARFLRVKVAAAGSIVSTSG